MPGLKDATLVPASPALLHPFFSMPQLVLRYPFLFLLSAFSENKMGGLKCIPRAAVLCHCVSQLLSPPSWIPPNKQRMFSFVFFPPNTFCSSFWMKKKEAEILWANESTDSQKQHGYSTETQILLFGQMLVNSSICIFHILKKNEFISYKLKSRSSD